MNTIENIKKANAEYLDLYGDIFEEGIILTEVPTFETIQKYFKDNNPNSEITFIYNGKRIFAKRKITYARNFVIKTNYLHILIELKKHGNLILCEAYREQKNNIFKCIGYQHQIREQTILPGICFKLNIIGQ